MALDFNLPLQGAGGSSPRRRKSGGAWKYLLVLLLIGGGVYYFYPSGSEPAGTNPEGSEAHETAETADSDDASSNMKVDTPEERSYTKKTIMSVAEILGDSDDADTAVSGPSASENTETASAEPAEEEAATSGPITLAAEEKPENVPESTPTEPVLTGVRAQWKKVQSLTGSGNYTDANEILKAIVAEHPEDDNGATALYWLGANAVRAGDVKSAQDYWAESYTKYSGTRGSRLAAAQLADIWFDQYCNVDLPKYKEWEVVRNTYSDALGRDDAEFLSAKQKKKIIERLIKLNEKVIFSRYPCKGADFYVVQKNDYLSTIARRYGVHSHGLATINGIRAPHYYIRPGEKLKIYKVPLEIVVDKSDYTLTLYMNGKWAKMYQICHGGPRTPPAKYTIANKDADPKWTDPDTRKVYGPEDPKNILGTRWMGFEASSNGLGIHGTTLPHTIPGDSSQGCVRMHNSDVEELYGLALIGTVVTIKE